MIKYATRAALSALMLAGVSALALAAVLAVATGLVVAASAGGIWAILAAIGAAGVIVLVGTGLTAARRRQRKPVEGVLVTDDEQPLLWVEILIVAEGLHMWAPRQLVLSPDASVIASENRTWLGLRQGTRRLQLGEVLLAGLTERQLRAVIAHEFCRFWGPSSFGRVIHRGRKIIGWVAGSLGEGSRAGRMVGRFGRAYVAVSDPVIRRHQLDADRNSANLVGNGATLAALREVAVLSQGWDEFVDGYLDPAVAVQRRPEDVFESFAHFLDYPTRRAQLAEAIGAPHPKSTYDSHPSLEDRLLAVSSLPEDGTLDRSGRALVMLRDPDHEIRRVHDWLFQDPEVKPATWEEIVPEAGRAAARQGARTLARLAQQGGLGDRLAMTDLLDIIRLGLVEELVGPLFGEGLAPEVDWQVAGRLVTAFLATAAIEAGTASYRFSWAAPSQLVDGRGEVADLPGLVDTALADPAQVDALVQWLGTHGQSMEFELGDQSGPAKRQDLPGEPDGPLLGPSEQPIEARRKALMA